MLLDVLKSYKLFIFSKLFIFIKITQKGKEARAKAELELKETEKALKEALLSVKAQAEKS